jgi:predicted enzyme related to lactoylglutathione lyase
MKPLLQYVDAVTVPVPDLDRGLAFYRDALGHQLLWRNEATGQAGLSTPRSATEIVLTTRQDYEPDWKVASASAAAEVFAANGGRVLVEPTSIPIGQLAIVEDPFGNRLVLLDATKGTYDTDASGAVTGVSLRAGLTWCRPCYSLRRATAGWTRAAAQPGQAAMRLASSSVTGTASRISGSGTSGAGATPAAFAKKAQA